MDKRGQSALEYLMTYGWALIVIAIVVGVLVYIMGSSTGATKCTSDTTEIIVKDQVASETGVQIVIQNATGTTITPDVEVLGGIFSGSPTGSGKMTSGSENTITLPGTLEGSFNGTYGFTYTSVGGLIKDANITCTGSV